METSASRCVRISSKECTKFVYMIRTEQLCRLNPLKYFDSCRTPTCSVDVSLTVVKRHRTKLKIVYLLDSRHSFTVQKFCDI